MADQKSTATRTGRANGADTGESLVSRLAGFFPGAVAVRVPIKITASSQKSGVGSQELQRQKPHKNNGNGAGEASEETVIEFGTAQEALFACSLPLEFEDRVRLENPDGTLQTDGDVVAVQYHEGRTAVAVRFARKMANWIIK